MTIHGTSVEYPNLHAARVRKGMSQAETGELIGKSQAHYGKIENGLVALKADDALILCEHFRLPLAKLLQRPEKKKKARHK